MSTVQPSAVAAATVRDRSRSTEVIDLVVWNARETQVLYASIAAALALWSVAFLNAVQLWTIEVRPGEGAGGNPAIDFIVLGLVVLLLPYGIVRGAHARRIEALERRLPEFLEDVAESGQHGLTLAEAVRAAARGHYGPLTPEVERMANEIAWGIPAADAFRGLESRIPTPLVRQMITIVARAQATGGRYPEVLRRVAHDARAEQLALDQRRDVMRTYVAVVALAFAVFLLTVYVLAAVYLPEMLVAGSGGALASTGYLVGVPVVASLFLALFAAVLVHGVGDGLVAGLLYRGRLAEGMTISAGMLLAGWIVLRFVVPPLGVG